MTAAIVDLAAARARLTVVMADLASITPVPSPCVSVCRMVPATALCEGCFRTIPEIAGWSRSTDADKLAVWGRIEQRLSETTS